MTTSGEQSVMTSGPTLMLELSAGNLDTHQLVSTKFIGHYYNITGTAYILLSYPIPGAIAYTNAYFGRGSGGIFMDNVGCRGTESTLLSCPYSGIGVHNCDHSADAGSSCFGNCILILLP